MADHIARAEARAARAPGELERHVAERTRQLHHLAHHDPLTQLPNRRQLSARLASALIARSSERPTSRAAVCRRGQLQVDQRHARPQLRRSRPARHRRALAGRGGRQGPAGAPGWRRVHGPDRRRPVGARKSRAARRRLSRRCSSRCHRRARALHERQRRRKPVSRPRRRCGRLAARRRRRAISRQGARPQSLCLLSSRRSTTPPHSASAWSNRCARPSRPAICCSCSSRRWRCTPSRSSGLEALLRWRKPDGRIATATEFIHIAEKTGLIHELTDWVLRSATSTVAPGARRAGIAPASPSTSRRRSSSRATSSSTWHAPSKSPVCRRAPWSWS